MTPKLQLPGATLILTLLTWYVADQLVTETEEVRVRVSVSGAPNSQLVVSPLPDAPEYHLVRISGGQSFVQKFREQGIISVSLTIDQPAQTPSGVGQVQIDLLEQLQSATSFPGCAVLTVQPDSLDIFVDRRIQAGIPVRVRPGALDYAVQPSVDHDTVQVTLLQSQYEAARDASPQITIEAEEILRKQQEDQPLRFDVFLPLSMDTDAGAIPLFRVEPDHVTLRATLRRRLIEGVIPAVPIKFLVSHNVNNRYDIEFRDPNPILTLSVEVIGPTNAVERLVSGEDKIFAMINIGAPDAFANGSFQFQKPEFNLPPGVTLKEDRRPDIEIRLIPRASNDPQSP